MQHRSKICLFLWEACIIIPSSWDSRGILFHPRTSCATFASKPTGTTHCRITFPRDSCEICGIPVILVPIQLSRLSITSQPTDNFHRSLTTSVRRHSVLVGDRGSSAVAKSHTLILLQNTKNVGPQKSKHGKYRLEKSTGDLNEPSTSMCVHTHTHTSFTYRTMDIAMDHGSVAVVKVVRTLDLQSTGRGFDSRPLHCRVATLGKSFTRDQRL